MSTERIPHKWYIEPLNAFTNEVLAKNQEFLSDEHLFNGVQCIDGKQHKMWGCQDYGFVNTFLRSRVSLGCVFKIWHQGGNGQIRQWEFHVQKKKRIMTVKRGNETVVLRG